ncbi:MAG: hypothetical protein J6Z11_04080 [Candidatus Riflebacteria bacterium]|nr:hypothetical protein [Candidatus Riflebacteria bacterium]
MIQFRKKKSLIQDLVPEAMDNLRKIGIPFNSIKLEQADSVSRVNSKAMVLRSFIKNDNGYYEMKVQDKELYNYTQKLIREKFQMRITDIDRKDRIITAECDHLGIALDIIEILGRKYNLSIVTQ